MDRPAHGRTQRVWFTIYVYRQYNANDGVKQFLVDVKKEESKFDTLIDVFKAASISQAVILCNTSDKVDWLTDKMHEAKFIVSSMHRGMPQSQQDSMMQDFQQGNSQVLISTDTDILTCRSGVLQLSVVINYDMPNGAGLENYIHRLNLFNSVSHSARKGAINFVYDSESHFLHEIEHIYSTKIEPLPSNGEIFLTLIQTNTDDSPLTIFHPPIFFGATIDAMKMLPVSLTVQPLSRTPLYWQ